MTADKYTAKFDMLVGSTSFNKVALEDAFIRGPPSADSLQGLLPDLITMGIGQLEDMCAIWTASIVDLLKQLIDPIQTQMPQIQTPAITHTLDTSAPMDIDQS